MQTVFIALPVLVFLCWLFTVGIALIVKIWAVNKEELADIRRCRGVYQTAKMAH
jgi:hypothetical protein